MSYEQKLSMQGVTVTLRLNYSSNKVLFDLILTSETGQKLASNGRLTCTSKEAKKLERETLLKKLEKEYEERVEEEKFKPSHVAHMLKKITNVSTFEEKKASFIECMTYLYEHRDEIVHYDKFLATMKNKCYEIKMIHPTDVEMNDVCDKILTHFGLETDVAVYAQKKAAKEEALKEKDRKIEQAVQKYREEVKRDEIYLNAVRKCREEHLELVAKAANPYNASFPVEPRLKELFQLEEQRWEQEQEQVRAYQKDRKEHLELLEKVANTYDIPFAKKMYDQYMDWKVTYRGNAKNRYKRMCEFMESLPLFK